MIILIDLWTTTTRARSLFIPRECTIPMRFSVRTQGRCSVQIKENVVRNFPVTSEISWFSIRTDSDIAAPNQESTLFPHFDKDFSSILRILEFDYAYSVPPAYLTRNKSNQKIASRQLVKMTSVRKRGRRILCRGYTLSTRQLPRPWTMLHS